ncbi:MAG TPA: COX15/CtaA family protein, partial [Thermoanaerobaculia bacterium]|nr:COX15/CtaA family protein [Thermoanaerobaculia bacterium]
HDESLARAFAISAHLLNTLLLLAALTLAAQAAGAFRSAAAGAASVAAAAGTATRFPEPEGAVGGLPDAATPPDLGNGLPAAASPDATAPLRAGSSSESGRWTGWALTLGLAGTMALAVTGAVAALGDTLFPAPSLQQGLAQDLSSASHLLLRLRSIHPLLAIVVGIYLLYLCREATTGGGQARCWGVRLRFLLLGQGALGLLNIALLAPVWLQLTHLLVADLVWIALVLLAVETLEDNAAAATSASPMPARAPAEMPRKAGPSSPPENILDSVEDSGYPELNGAQSFRHREPSEAEKAESGRACSASGSLPGNYLSSGEW